MRAPNSSRTEHGFVTDPSCPSRFHHALVTDSLNIHHGGRNSSRTSRAIITDSIQSLAWTHQGFQPTRLHHGLITDPSRTHHGSSCLITVLSRTCHEPAPLHHGSITASSQIRHAYHASLRTRRRRIKYQSQTPQLITDRITGASQHGSITRL